MTPSDLARMTDHEIATHASGGYGPAKRNEFSRCLREMLKPHSAKADAKDQILNRTFAARFEGAHVRQQNFDGTFGDSA